MVSEDRLYWIWLADRCGPATKEFGRLISRFENPYEIFRLEPEEIDTIDCIGKRLRDRLSQKSLEHAYSILRYCSQNGIDIITYGDKRYPSRLKRLEDPPAVLYCLGEFPNFNDKICIAVVGTRKISAYGMQSAYKISYEIASAGACVVSGMALGIDAVAACAAIEAGGCTVAVLGCGIDVLYPKQHAKLRRAIIKNGCIVSEFPPAEAPYGSNFPKRNRIISGLCQGVFVVEGNKRSGAMITAQKAIDQGREVYALPGKINESNSEGPNDLIQKGVYVALCAEDILCNYEFLYGETINYNRFIYSKYHSDLSLDVLKKFGVSCEVYYGANELSGAQQDVGTTDKADESDTKETETKEPERENYEDTEVRRGSDNSAAILEGLDSVTRRVLDAMPLDRSISPDEFVSVGISISEAVTSLSILEIMGLVSSLPGGTYIRK